MYDPLEPGLLTLDLVCGLREVVDRCKGLSKMSEGGGKMSKCISRLLCVVLLLRFDVFYFCLAFLYKDTSRNKLNILKVSTLIYIFIWREASLISLYLGPGFCQMKSIVICV